MLSLLTSDLCAGSGRGQALWRQLGEQVGGPPALRPGNSRGSCFNCVLYSLPRLLILPPPSPFTPFSSLKSQVQFRETAFSCPYVKRKRKERKLPTTSKAQKKKRKTPKPQGKGKPSFLGNANDLLSRYLDKFFLRKKKKMKKQHTKIENAFLECGCGRACDSGQQPVCVYVCKRERENQRERLNRNPLLLMIPS